MEQYRLSLRFREEIGDKRGMTESYNNIGTIHLQQGNIPLALEHYQQSLRLQKEIGNKRRDGIFVNNIGIIYFERQQPDSALYYCHLSLEVAEELEFPELIFNASNSLYQIYKHLGNSPNIPKQKREQYLLQSLEHHKVYFAMQDSLHNEKQSEELGKLRGKYEFESAMKEKERQQQKQKRIEKEQTAHRHNLQYTGSFIFIIVVMLFVAFSGWLRILAKLGEALLFFTLMLFFEFVLIITEPTIDRWTGGEPILKLMINSTFAFAITQLHGYLEPVLKTRLFAVRKKKNMT